MDIEQLQQLVRKSIQSRRRALVFHMAHMIVAKSNSRELRYVCDIEDENSWVKIESLSQLRSLVGGRFQKLKERWLGAGFPLREHRGDRAGGAEIAQEGWTELSLWINRQGYKTRLGKNTDSWLFEVFPIEERLD